MARRILLITNPSAASGRATQRWDALLAGLRERGLTVEQAVTVHHGHGIEIAQQAAGQYDTIVAVGGDGTVHEVASGILLSGRDVAMGIIPFGTGNDVASLLGIGSIEDGIAVLAEGEAHPLDAIQVRCRHHGETITRYALLYASVGFTGEVLKYTTPLVKRFFGSRYCYSAGFLRALFSYRSPRMTISTDGQTFTGPMFALVAGNAEYTGGGTMRLCPGARMDDGLMNINIVQALGKLEILRHFPRLLAGTHIDLPTVQYFPATSLTIDTELPQVISMDGDLFGETPATFSMMPGALRVLCMQHTAERKGDVRG
ncbi:MAG: diacylglycerol/lipid kinase family protein [Armatimonadota bacterium]